MASSKLGLLLLSGLMLGCASHQVTEKPLTPSAVTPFESMQVQVKFATPAHSDYLAAQLVDQLNRRGVKASRVTSAEPAATPVNANAALLQLTLTGTWTETFISHRQKTRRSLTQMRGRIPRESPRFRSDLVVVNLQTGKTVWQTETVTAGAWYTDFNTMARSLAARLGRELDKQGLLGSPPAAASS